MTFPWKNIEDNASPAIKRIRIILLIMIVVGVALLLTRNTWVPKLVDYIIKNESTSVVYVPVLPGPTTKVPLPVVRAGKVDTGVEFIATIGPTCPVVRIPADPKCADKPFETTLVLVDTRPGRGGGVLIKTDKDGYFSRELAPGTYMIRAQNENTLPRLAPATFEVVAHNLVSLNLQFDSGIR